MTHGLAAGHMSGMSKWTARASVAGHPDEVLDLLTEPAAIRSWAPIPFEVTALDGDRLEAGSVARVSGGLAGRKVSFEVEVIEAGEGRLSLIASGPITLDVEYDVRPAAAGSQVEASVAVSGASGLGGRLLGTATDALLAAGALSSAVDRIGQQFEPALAA